MEDGGVSPLPSSRSEHRTSGDAGGSDFLEMDTDEIFGLSLQGPIPATEAVEAELEAALAAEAASGQGDRADPHGAAALGVLADSTAALRQDGLQLSLQTQQQHQDGTAAFGVDGVTRPASGVPGPTPTGDDDDDDAAAATESAQLGRLAGSMPASELQLDLLDMPEGFFDPVGFQETDESGAQEPPEAQAPEQEEDAAQLADGGGDARPSGPLPVGSEASVNMLLGLSLAGTCTAAAASAGGSEPQEGSGWAAGLELDPQAFEAELQAQPLVGPASEPQDGDGAEAGGPQGHGGGHQRNAYGRGYGGGHGQDDDDDDGDLWGDPVDDADLEAYYDDHSRIHEGLMPMDDEGFQEEQRGEAVAAAPGPAAPQRAAEAGGLARRQATTGGQQQQRGPPPLHHQQEQVIEEEEEEAGLPYLPPQRLASSIDGLAFPVTSASGDRVYCRLEEPAAQPAGPAAAAGRARGRCKGSLLTRPISELYRVSSSGLWAAAPCGSWWGMPLL